MFRHAAIYHRLDFIGTCCRSVASCPQWLSNGAETPECTRVMRMLSTVWRAIRVAQQDHQHVLAVTSHCAVPAMRGSSR